MACDRLIHTATPLSIGTLDALDELAVRTRCTRSALVRAAVGHCLALPGTAWCGGGYRRPGRPAQPLGEPAAPAARAVAAAAAVEHDDEPELEDSDEDDIEVEEPAPATPAAPSRCSVDEILVGVGLAEPRKGEP